MAFIQAPPELENQYTDDRLLSSWLRRNLPAHVLVELEPSFTHMGALAAGPLHELSIRDRSSEPKHTAWDAWGNRIDKVEVNQAWQEYARVAARDGLVAIAYERSHAQYSRIHQFVQVYLFAPSTQAYACPLAMSDGCARTLEVLASDELKQRAFAHLVSRDPASAWTSGQWMTERAGGSDVGTNETVARLEDGQWRLYGTKWFTSAVSSEVALVLARPEGNAPGGKGLALFFVELRDRAGNLQRIVVNRLKEKLGTRNLPTAELTLAGTPAELVAGLSDGVRSMSHMLNITRTWNAVWAASSMRRCLALTRDYAKRRVAFGRPLSEKPLYLETLCGMAAEYEAAFHLVFHEVALLGRQEAGTESAEVRLLGVLQPLAKLLTAKQAVAVASETLECFGGAGYIEDTGIPSLLRDAQVMPIWEGTSDVLSLEVLRALRRDQTLPDLVTLVRERTAHARYPRLVEAAAMANNALEHVVHEYDQSGNDPLFEARARGFCLTLGRVVELALMIDHAQWRIDHEADYASAFAAERFAESGVDLLRPARNSAANTTLALGLSPSAQQF